MTIHPSTRIDAASAQAITSDVIDLFQTLRRQVDGFSYDRKVAEKPYIRSTLVRLALNFSYGSEKAPYTTCLRNDMASALDWLESLSLDERDQSLPLRNAAVALLRLKDSGLLEHGEINRMPSAYFDHDWRTSQLQRFDSLPLKDRMGLGIYDCCYDSDQSLGQLLKTYRAILDSQLQIRETIEEAHHAMADSTARTALSEDTVRMRRLLGLLQESVNHFDQFLYEQTGQLYDMIQSPPDRWKGR